MDTRDTKALAKGLLASAGLSTKGEPLPSLLEVVSEIGTLDRAWQRVLASGKRSRNPTTKRAVEAFGGHSDTTLRAISDELRAGIFSFGVARGATIERDGKDPRPLVVPAIPARIVQRALLDVLQVQPGIKAYVEHPCSYGGVSRPSDADIRDPRAAALEHVSRSIQSGALFYVRSDIPGFFRGILRNEVLRHIGELLPDSSIDALLDSATILELGNADQIRQHIDLFPDGDVGVAQGCCLSPLFGNVYLRGFDDQMNSDCQVTTIRYVDDFMVLGASQEAAHRSFANARRILKELELDAYPPGSSGGKAKEGKLTRGLDFLGCHVTPHAIEPSRDARRAFLTRVRGELDLSSRALKRGLRAGGDDHKLSFIESLSRVSRMVRGWTEQYAFCNETDAFRSVDVRVDALLNRYSRTFFKHYRKRRSSSASRRRTLGVWLAEDCERHPLLPLARESKNKET